MKSIENTLDATQVVFQIEARILLSDCSILAIASSLRSRFGTTLKALFKSINLPPGVVPIMSIKQVHTTKLGLPYSLCRLSL